MTSEENLFWDRTPEEQANARFSLVVSAKQARMNGCPKDMWVSSDEVQSYIKRYQLREDIAEHVACFVWTFRR